MPRRLECCRLRGLIGSSLPKCNEGGGVLLTKDDEKRLLVSLSRALRQMETGEMDHGSGNHEAEQPVVCGRPSASSSIPQLEKRGCLTKIVDDIIGWLSAKNQFVRHLAGNMLIKMSAFLAASGSLWDGFICSLCSSVEKAITELLLSSAASLAGGSEDFNPAISGSAIYSKQKPVIAIWYKVAGLFQVLRGILKHMDDEDEDKFLMLYLEYISSTLRNIPWYKLDKICCGHSVGDGVQQKLSNITGEEPKILLIGNFVQFACSLVQRSLYLEDPCASRHLDPVLPIIINLVPNALHWCLSKQGNYSNTCIIQYFRHKLLVLMTRLTFQSQLNCSNLTSWLKLLELYFREFLQKPIYKVEPHEGNCLEESPFMWNLHNSEVSDAKSGHLQRLSVFLFIRCSISSINLRKLSDKQCVCTTVDYTECPAPRKGLLELSNWIQRHVPNYSFANHEQHAGLVIKFSASFIQLYMHEDDLLFKMLLQLISAPCCAQDRLNEEGCSLQDGEQVTLFEMSMLFNPVHLFHVFLSELHYDHQVLLDYLISKDTGTSCAEYLLRSLRAVCDSWDLFIRFSIGGKLDDVPSLKRRKVLFDGLDSGTSKSVPRSFEKQQCRSSYERYCESGGMSPFQNAKNCLLRLKISIENLHQKNLFPYNPEVLLRRLTRFQAFCFNQ